MGFILWKEGSYFMAEGFGQHEGNFKDRDSSNLATTMSEDSNVLEAHRFNEITFSELTNNSRNNKTSIVPIEQEARGSILGILDTVINGDNIYSKKELMEEYE